jgi:GNAT superfamily N-acetyltransferase
MAAPHSRCTEVGMRAVEALPPLTFHEVDGERWPDLLRLFEARGGPSYCWCMVWRRMPDESQRRDRASKKAALAGSVASGTPVGILGYAGDEPVAWCSIAPRETYRPLDGPIDPADERGAVWSLVCFFVPRSLRGRGITRRLIAAAIDHAGSRGARVVEAYPVDPDSPSYRFGGFLTTFADAGFEEVGRAGSRRHVMRYRIAPARTRGA